MPRWSRRPQSRPPAARWIPDLLALASLTWAVCADGRRCSTSRRGIDVPRHGPGRPSCRAPAVRRSASSSDHWHGSNGDRGRGRRAALVEDTPAASTSIRHRCVSPRCVDLDAPPRAAMTAGLDLGPAPAPSSTAPAGPRRIAPAGTHLEVRSTRPPALPSGLRLLPEGLPASTWELVETTTLAQRGRRTALPAPLTARPPGCRPTGVLGAWCDVRSRRRG